MRSPRARRRRLGTAGIQSADMEEMNCAVGFCAAPDEGMVGSSNALSMPVDLADAGIAYFGASKYGLDCGKGCALISSR